MVLEKDKEISSTDRVRNEEVLQSQGREECPTKNNEKESSLGWSRLA